MIFCPSLLVLAYAASLVATQSTRQYSNCSAFSWDQQPAYIINDTERTRVSAASTCPLRSNESHACPIEVHGDLQASFQSNISSNVLRDYFYNTATGSSSFYFDLVNGTIPSASSSSTGVPFRNYVIGNVNIIKTLEPGTSGYLEFARLLQCYAGTLSNCTAGTIDDGTAVEFCAPIFHSTALRGERDGVTILDGSYFVKQVNASQVEQFHDPFSGQARSESTSIFSAAHVRSTSLGLAVVTSFLLL